MYKIMQNLTEAYNAALATGDPRVENWLLMRSPVPITVILLIYLVVIATRHHIMANVRPLQLKWLVIPYNLGLVALSAYMFYELVVTSVLSNYSYTCQPVDYSISPLAMRMAKVCWWFFFSKVIELLDTILEELAEAFGLKGFNLLTQLSVSTFTAIQQHGHQVQFFAMLVHTSMNLFTTCDYPHNFNYAVLAYATSLILLFSNFYYRSYTVRHNQKKLL